MPKITTAPNAKTRAVRAAAKAIGVGERWITSEHFAREFAAEIIAAIESAGIALVDADAALATSAERQIVGDWNAEQQARLTELIETHEQVGYFIERLARDAGTQREILTHWGWPEGAVER